MDKVNHPSHYNHEGKKECIEEMLETYGSTITGIFCLTNAYKYLYRMGSKDGESARDDFEKATWYISFFHKRIGLSLTSDRELGRHMRYLAREVDSGLFEVRKRLKDN